MALGKPVRATKPATAPAPEPEDNVINSITVARGFTVSMGEYNSIKVQVTVSGGDYDTVSAEVEEKLALELEKAGVQFNTLTGAEPGDDDTGEEAEGEAEAGDEEGEAEALSADDVMAMKRPDLVTLIEENSLEIDPDDHPKNAKGLASLREAVVEAAFGDGDGEEASDDAEADAGEEDEITEEAINAMDRPTIVKFIKDNSIEVDPAKHSKLTALKAAVIEALSEGGEEEAEADAEEEAAPEAYTEADLKKLTVDDLKAIYSDWGMGKFPAGPPVKAKTLAIKAILTAQAEA